MRIRFFADPQEMRAWLAENHSKLDEQWIGYYKKGSGIPSIDWAESVDVALCFGWIDGVRKSIDAKSFKIRFTPRRPKSGWSARNIARMEALIAAGLVAKPGLAAFRSRPPDREAQRLQLRSPAELPPAFLERLRADPGAWAYFEAARPSYQKQATTWILSAKKEETRLSRLKTLVDCCARGEFIPPLRWSQPAKGTEVR